VAVNVLIVQQYNSAVDYTTLQLLSSFLTANQHCTNGLSKSNYVGIMTKQIKVICMIKAIKLQ